MNIDEMMVDKYVKQCYDNQKYKAMTRGLSFDLSLYDWCLIWVESGRWKDRGKGASQYCMCRVGDSGGYALGNVYIDTNSNNSKSVKHKQKEGSLLCGYKTKYFYVCNGEAFNNQKELTKRFNVSLRTIQNWVRAGKIQKITRKVKKKYYCCPLGCFNDLSFLIKEYQKTRQTIYYWMKDSNNKNFFITYK